MVKTRAIIFIVSLLVCMIGGISEFAIHKATTHTAADINPASIAAVRQHPLVASVIATTSHLAARGGCSTSVISYRSDGLKEFALAQQPASNVPKGGYPVIIFAHGYTSPVGYDTANTQYASILNWYCGHGYLVFKPDYRGYGHSEGLPVNGLYSPSDTYDVLNLAASLGSYHGANASRVALIGHSMGGGIVLRAGVASHGLPVKAIVTMAGAVASLPTMTYHWTGSVPPDVATARRQALSSEGPPSQDPAYWYNASATNYLSSLTAPIQINQGLTDASVPPTFADDLNSELTAVGRPHEYYAYPNTGHLFANPASLNLFLTRSTAFLDHYDS